MASEIKGEIEMRLDQANAQIRSQQAELKKLRTEMRGTQVDANKAGDSLNKQARRARSDLAVFGAQGRVMGQLAQGFTSLLGPIGIVGGAVMAAGYAWEKFDEHMQDVIKHSREMKLAQLELNRAMNEDAAKLGKERIAGAEGRAQLKTLYPGQDAEKLVDESVQKYGIEEDIVRKILFAIGGRMKKKPVAERPEIIDKFMAAFTIANIGPGATADEIIKDFQKNPSIRDPKKRAARIAGVTEEVAVSSWIKNAQSKEVQTQAAAVRRSAEIQAQSKKPSEIEKSLSSYLATAELEAYRKYRPGLAKAEEKIKPQIEKARVAKLDYYKMLEETTFGDREGMSGWEGEVIGFKNLLAAISPWSVGQKDVQRENQKLQEMLDAESKQLGGDVTPQLLMKMVTALESIKSSNEAMKTATTEGLQQ